MCRALLIMDVILQKKLLNIEQLTQRVDIPLYQMQPICPSKRFFPLTFPPIIYESAHIPHLSPNWILSVILMPWPLLFSGIKTAFMTTECHYSFFESHMYSNVTHQSSGPQPFWHQGPVSWKTIFPLTGVGGWFGDDSSTLHLLCTLFLLLLHCNI